MTMKQIIAGDAETRSVDVVEENIALLRELFPELVTETEEDGETVYAIDVEVLKQLVGDRTVKETEEKYGLNWHGKRAARRLALTPSTGTLRPCPEESVDWDTTQNLMIEGDNLEVLKLLQKSYAGKVKLIYIDPPYNTGKDFVYPDNFRDNIQNYLELTGQTEGGAKITSNPDSSGRFHTDWLGMIYPRLRLARTLLQHDGILAISIDDTEVANLRRVLDELFGEEQFQAQIIVQSNKRGQTYKQISKTHEFLLMYSKSEALDLNELEKSGDALPFEDSVGQFDLWELRNRNPKFGRFNRPNLFFPIYVNPNSLDECGYAKISLEPFDGESIKVLPLNSEGEESCWRWGKDKIKGCDLNTSSPVLIGKERRDGHWNIYEKSRKSTTRAKSIWADTCFINEQGTVELGRIGMGDVFDHPKPVALIERCIFLATDSEDIVLDFFAGSGTTGHATMQLNSIDGGHRRFLLVQLPEPLEPGKPPYKFCKELKKPESIAELTKERLRRAGKKIKEENPMFPGDVGFRVFRLDTSNIRAWDPDREDLDKTLLESIEHIKQDRSEQDVLYELLLKLGLDLCVPIETKEIAGKTVHSIGAGTLIACLDEEVSREEVEPLGLGIVEWHRDQNPAGETTVVFRDSGFEDDVAKTNLAAILQQNGIETVRSL